MRRFCQNINLFVRRVVFLQLLLVLGAYATYDIDDAILYRVSFNEFGAKTSLNGDLNQKSPDEIKLHGYSSKVKEPEPGSDVPSTVIPDHSDLKLKNPERVVKIF